MLDQKHRDTVKNVGRHKIFAFKDGKSESYGPPMTVETKGIFIRQVQEELERGNAIWAKHPHDFSIFELGEYDLFSGNIHLHETKNCLGLVLDFKSQA